MLATTPASSRSPSDNGGAPTAISPNPGCRACIACAHSTASRGSEKSNNAISAYAPWNNFVSASPRGISFSVPTGKSCPESSAACFRYSALTYEDPRIRQGNILSHF